MRPVKSTVSRHLRELWERRLVVARREGVAAVYSFADQRVVEILDITHRLLIDSLSERVRLLVAEERPQD
jgi:DNA-binding transcriptional ArsR family regulator